LLAGLKKGHINFILEGKKLKGEFALVKIKSGKQENAWLLLKAADKYATDADITQKNKSVISGVTLEALAKKYGNEKNGLEGLRGGERKARKPVKEKQAPVVKKKPA
jgi:bifunctional non-homologous end joining protein LigD